MSAIVRRRTCRQPCLIALLAAAAFVAAVVPGSAFSQAKPAAKKAMKPPSFTPAKRTPQALAETLEPAKKTQEPDWFTNLFGMTQESDSKSDASSIELALGDATKVLMAMGSVVGAASLADSAGLIYAADVLDVLDAQALISEGQAEAASVNMDDNLVNLQLALQDGSRRIVTLFAK